MEFDVMGNLNAMERRVSFLEQDGRAASAVTLSRSYSTSVEDLWDAVTKLERIPLWFAPVSGKLEPRGHYAIEGNASGTITECEPLSHFTLTWEFAGDVSWVVVRVREEEEDRTRLTLAHTALLSPHWDEYGPGAVGVGWEMGFLGLAMHIADPNAPKPDEMEFATSPDGKAFIIRSSEEWGKAAITAGTPPTVALESARHTTAFYTGEAMGED